MLQAIIAVKAGACAVIAKVRIGHFVEAQILEAIGVDFIDESEVLQLVGLLLLPMQH